MSAGSFELLKAIKLRYDAKLKSQQFFDQEIYFGLAADSAVFPYVVVNNISNIPDGWSSSGSKGGNEFRFHSMQFTIFDPDLDVVGPKQTALHDAFDFAPMTMTDGSCVIDFRRTNDFMLHGDIERSRDVQDKQIYQAVSLYEVKRVLTTNFNPS